MDTPVVIESANPDSVDGFENVWLQYIANRPGTGDSLLVQEHDIVAVTPRQVEVVKHDNGGERERSDQLKDVMLKADIEMVGRFVEQENRCALRQATGNRHALAFPTGKLSQSTAGKVEPADLGERIGNDGPIVRRKGLMIVAMRCPAEKD